MLSKATSLPADEVIVDLEDGVAVAMKDAALSAAVATVSSWPGARLSVRINPPGTAWCHRELIALAGAGERLGSVVVPKVQSAGDLAFLDRLLDGVEATVGRSAPIAIQALIETPAGLARVMEIAGASSRLQSLILGYADLGASLGRAAPDPASLDLWLAAQEAVLLAARVHDLQAIDGPFLGTADDEPFRAVTRRARALGFDGKWAIHPNQLAALNEMFRPSEDEVTYARAVIDALDRGAGANGAGAVKLDGEMLDEAMRRSALRVLVRAEGPISP